MHKPYALLLLLLFAIVPSISFGQTWKALGKDESNTPSLNITSYNNIAISPDGTPYVTFIDIAKNDSVVVKKFDGTKWVQVGDNVIAGNYPKLAFGTDGTPYLAHMTLGGNGVVRKLIGDNWVKLGPEIGGAIFPDLSVGPDNTLYLKYTAAYGYGFKVKKFTNGFVNAGDLEDVAGSPGFGQIAVATDGTLYTAYAALKNKNKISVKKLVAGKWELVGVNGFSNTGAANVNLAITSDGIPFVAYQDSTAGGGVVVQQFKNNAWSVVSPADLSKGEARFISLAIAPDKALYLTFCDVGNNSKAIVKKLSNGSWATVGSSSLLTGEAWHTHITIAKNGTPYLTYEDNNWGGKGVVKMFTGGKWVDVGMGDISAEVSKKIVVKASKNGNIYSAFTDDVNSGKASLKQYVSGAWRYVGTPTLSSAGVVRSEMDMDLGPEGLPYIIYQDSSQLTCVVKKYNGTAWVQLGSSISPFSGFFFKIAIASDGTPYIAYSDNGYGGRITVKKYRNNNWEIVGQRDVSDGYPTEIDLAIDKNNVPYLAYIDNITKKANVQRFNGTSWEYLAGKNFTASVRNINLITGPDGIPYITFYDNESGKIVVSSFTNNSWQAVGGANGSAQLAHFPKLFFNPGGQLYLAFLQGSLTTGLTTGQLRRLSQGQWLNLASEGMLPNRALIDHSITFIPNGDIIYGYLNGGAFVRTNSSDDQKANPVLNGLSPTFGSTGTEVTIKGFNLSNATAVNIGANNAASFTVVSPTVITAIVGKGATGNVTVTTPNGSTAIARFEYMPPPPVINSFSPHSGEINSTVTIKGKYFSAAAAENIVYFGAVTGQVITANDSTLTVEVPVGATSSPITVTTKQFTAYAATEFIVTFKSTNTFTAATFNNKYNVGTESLSPMAVAVKDMDSDGKPDIIVNGAIFANASTKDKFTFNTYLNIDMGGQSVEAHDMDSDGKPDLLIPTGPVSIYKNTSAPGNITFLANKQFIDQAEYSFKTVPGDIDGDGRPDFLALSNGSSKFAVCRNAGTKNGYTYFDDPIIIDAGSSVDGAVLTDVDGDGKTDLVVLVRTYTGSLNSYGYLAVYKNTGTAGKMSFKRIVSPKIQLAGEGAAKPIVTDIDNDGKPDIVTVNFNANTISVFRNNSSAANISFEEALTFSTAKKPYAICAADLDGDGLLDIATANIGDESAVSVLKNTTTAGGINFDAKVDYNSILKPGSIAAADLDGDKAPELIVSNYIGDNVTIFKNDVTQAKLPINNFTVSALSATCKGSANGSINIVATQNSRTQQSSLVKA